MRGLTALLIDGPWTVTCTASGNVFAAQDAVRARMERGLATEEALAIVTQTGLPADLVGTTFPASVPGDVHQDLQRAGVLPDPHLGLNEFHTQWIGRCVWEYRTTFDVSELRACNELVFEGIDTIAEVYLNDVWLLSARDMHLTYAVDVTHHLRLGRNELRVVFAAQEDWADAQQAKVGRYPNAYSDPTNQIRKMASNYGWDWGPTLVTAGLWRPVSLRQFDARLEHLRVIPFVEADQAKLRVAAEVIGAADDLTLRLELDSAVRDSRTVEGSCEFTIDVDDVEWWYPIGYGSQPLYDLRIELVTDSGQVLDAATRSVGFRSVTLVSEPDEFGTSFEFLINGQRIWIRGANWIPDHTSIAVVDRQMYETAIQDAIDAKMNLLRIWGGGIFESDDFYEICDREGILVWQDFLFACAAYPEDEATARLIEAEVVNAVPRLASHPSLILWNGNNENIWGYFDWGWQEELGDRAWGMGYYTDLIPNLLHRLDPTRPYQPSSPWSGTMALHPNDPNHGTSHLWEQWNRQDYPTYRDSVPRFVTEYGYQAPPAYSTLAEALGEDQLHEDSVGMRAHQKALDGDKKLRRALDIRFAEPQDFDTWHYLTQLEQARAMDVGIRHLRAHHDRCSGSVIWQLNDCWPSISWSLVDQNGHRKPVWHAVRKAYADRILAFRSDGAKQFVVAVNDHANPWTAPLTLQRIRMDGDVVQERTVALDVAPYSMRLIECTDLVAPADPANEFLRARVEALSEFHFLAEDNELDYPTPQYDLAISKTDCGVSIAVTAVSLLRDVCCFVDRIDADATVDDSFTTVLPGETVVFDVQTKHPQRFLEADYAKVLRTAAM